MKISKYNFFYEYKEDNNKILAYNSRTNSLALINKAKFEKLDKFINYNLTSAK